MSSAASRSAVAPLVVVAVVLLELVTGAHATVLSLVVIAPLLAASSQSPRATGRLALLSVVVAALLGVYGHHYDPGRRSDQAIRLTTVSVGGLLALASARTRVLREARLARVLQVAAVAQAAILPPVPERLGPLLLAASYDSAIEEAQVGGDVYAAEQTPFGVRLLVADVRGHGLEAVRLSAAVLGTFRERARERHDLAELIADLDAAVLRQAEDEDFVTALVVQVDGTRLSAASAGHDGPLLLDGRSAVRLAPRRPSPPLGLSGDVEVFRGTLEPGSRLLLHTDGVTEARRPGDGAFFPLEERAATVLAGSPTEALSALRDELRLWTGGTLADDVTMVLAVPAA